MTAINDRVTLFNGFALDRMRGCLLDSGEPVHLRPQTYRLLEYLADNHGRLMSNDLLIDAVWQGRAVTDGAVGKCIEELRGVFGEEGRQYLRNVRGRGYIFDREPLPDVQTVRETHAEEIDVVRVIVEETNEPSSAIARPLATRERSRSTTASLIAICLPVFLFVGGYWIYKTRRPALVITSVAVLPLKNESGNPELDYLSDGMTESLINRLSRVPGLTIKARSTVFQYKGDVDALKVATALSVQAVLTGRLIQRGDDVTLYLSLVDGRTGDQIWGDQYDRKLDQLAALEGETTIDIAQHLDAKLRPVDQQSLSSGSTQNSEAYRTYLKGRYYWNNPSRGGYKKSLELFTKAIDLDPTFALGYVGLGHYYGFAAATGLAPPDENWQRSEAAVKKALELDPGRSETYNALAGIQLYYHRDWNAAERSFKQGLELNPSSAEVRRHYAKCLILFGRNDEAMVQIQRVLELEPLSVAYSLDAGKVYFWAEQYPQAIEHLKSTLELEPNSRAAHDLLGFVYAKMGDQKAAITEWGKLLSLTGNDDLASRLQTSFERSGFQAALRMRGQEELRRLAEGVKNGDYVAPSEYATAYTMTGDKEQALRWLEKATQEHTRFALEFKVLPLYDNLRGDPRFQQLADAVRITE